MSKSADRFFASDTTLGILGAQNGTHTDYRRSIATCKQGLLTNLWSSNSIWDVYILPVAPSVLPKCSSVSNVHTRLRTTWTAGAVTQNLFGFCFSYSHHSSTVLQLSINRFDTVSSNVMSLFFAPFTMQRKRNGNLIMMPTHIICCVIDHRGLMILLLNLTLYSLCTGGYILWLWLSQVGGRPLQCSLCTRRPLHFRRR